MHFPRGSCSSRSSRSSPLAHRRPRSCRAAGAATTDHAHDHAHAGCDPHDRHRRRSGRRRARVESARRSARRRASPAPTGAGEWPAAPSSTPATPPTPRAAAATVFAVVPAVERHPRHRHAGAGVGCRSWARRRRPHGTATGSASGSSGAQAPLQTKVVSPAWGARLRSLLGTAQGSMVNLAVDDGELGAARAAQADASLRAAGFRVAAPVTVPGAAGPAAGSRAARGPARGRFARGRRCCSPRPRPPARLAQLLAALGFTGTVAADVSMYQPTTPAVASGLTVLVPYAPLEQATAANRRLAADVEAFAPGTQLTPGHRRRLLVGRPVPADARPRPASASPASGSSRWRGASRTRCRPPSARRGGRRAHAQGVPCGALVQSDGPQYLVAEPYACGKPDRRQDAEAIHDHDATTTTR